MTIESLELHSFRNIPDANVTTASRDVFLVGPNGQGKTNFLEALYYLSYGSSLRGSPEAQIATRGSDAFSIIGSMRSGGLGFERVVKYEEGKKTLFEGGKRIHDRSVFLEGTPMISFGHGDIEYAAGEPELRRRFLDQTACLAYPAFAETLRRYRHVLKSRNAVLRERRAELLDALDPQLVEYGRELVAKREEVARDFNDIFGDLFEEVARLGAKVRLAYSSSWEQYADAAETLRALEERRERDLEMGTSMSGPHRDRLRCMDDYGCFTDRASTGQLRLLSLVQRVAQARYVTTRTGRKPILLFDDVLLELDPEKRVRFTATMPDYEQAFYTFLPGEPYDHYRSDSLTVYSVQDGRFTIQESR